MTAGRAREAMAAVAVVAVACTPFRPGTDELEAESAMLRGPAGVGRDWSCLTDEEALPPLVPETMNARRQVVSIQILSLIGGDVIPGVSVRACALRDVDCTDPISEPLPLNAAGWVDVPLYVGFVGYLEFTGAALYPTLVFIPDPLTADEELFSIPFGLMERSVAPGLIGSTGIQQSSEYGLLALRALDCSGVDGRGVRYSIDKEGVAWYFVDGLPSTAATETVDSSVGGFMNVPAGTALVSADVSSMAEQVLPPTSVLVRPGWATALRFEPRQE